MRQRLVRLASTAAVACLASILLSVLVPAPVSAMPNFAQATGLECSACHLSVPGLNAKGRLVQRTAFAALDSQQLEHAVPIWLSEQTTYATDAGYEPHRAQVGNAAIHLDGGLGPDVTFHIQQWLVNADQTGNLDTAWVAYNKLMDRQAHVYVGYMPEPSPSFYQFWLDISGFSSASYSVGEHTQALGSNRWGYKVNYAPKNVTLEAGWGGASGTPDTAFTPATDKAFQWRTAYANAKSPIEAGLFGSNGTTPLAEGGIDRFNTVAAYVQLDSVNRRPGALLLYNVGYDGNPIATGQPASSHAYTAEIYAPLLKKWDTMISARTEMTIDGLGTTQHNGNVDLNFRIAKYLRGTVESGFASQSTPAWRWMVWWAMPVERCCSRGL
jgi:hypothetical protein